jgi:hypothetical protein
MLVENVRRHRFLRPGRVEELYRIFHFLPTYCAYGTVLIEAVCAAGHPYQ